MFTQPFIQAQIKENIKASRHWPLGPVTRKMFPFDDVIMCFVPLDIACHVFHCAEKRKVVTFTAMVVIGDLEACLQRLQWQAGQSKWRPFHFRVKAISVCMMTSSNGSIFRINGWVNNREAGDLRRYRAHYDVIVMIHRWMSLNSTIKIMRVFLQLYQLFSQEWLVLNS